MGREEKARDIVITDVTVIDVKNGERSKQDIAIQGDRIRTTGYIDRQTVPKHTRIIEGGGKFAIPGLWDAHVHMSAWPDYVHLRSQLYLVNGVTCVRDMGGKLEEILALRAHNEKDGVAAPRMWIAGPIIDGKPHVLDGSNGISDLAVAVDSPAEARQLVDDLVDKGIDFVKPYEMLRPEVFKALVERAKHHGLPASGHVPIRMSIKEVLDACEHYDLQHLLGGIVSGIKYDCAYCHHPMPDRKAIIENCRSDDRGWSLVSKIVDATDIGPEHIDPEKIKELVEIFVEKNNWHTFTLSGRIDLHGLNIDAINEHTLKYIPKKYQSLMLGMRRPDAEINNYEMKKSAFRAWHLDLARQMHQAGVRILCGTEIPGQTAGFSTHTELQSLVAAGLSPLEALQSATLNPAEFFGIENEFGSLEEGKYAEIVLLNRDPLIDIRNTTDIHAVVSRGRYYLRPALDIMLATIAQECERLA